MENIKNVWLYIEPFVFISEDNEGVLFYNTNTGDGLTFKKNNAVKKVVDHLQCIDNMYSVLVNMDDLEDVDLYNLVISLQKKGFGDIIEGGFKKPVILPPFLNLQRDIERMKKNNMSVGENILSYLHEITIYVNGDCRQNCPGCRKQFKQFPFCTRNEDVLGMDKISRLLSSTACSVANINITGGNPLQYPHLNELLDELDRQYAIKTFMVNYLHLPEDSGLLRIFSSGQFRLKILVCDSYQTDELFTISRNLQKAEINQQWLISITSEQEYEKADLFYQQLAEENIEVDIKPYYDGHNLAFFEDNIYSTREDILAINHSKQDIFALQVLNTNSFGRLTIMPDGNVYADVNHEPLGTINDSIYDILCSEMENGRTWRNTRHNTTTCKQCMYRMICPSPSNYEIAIGRPNLCHAE